MAGKRPCSECKRWFTKDPRVGNRQHLCHRPECRAARNRKACSDWRRENPDKVIASRLPHRLPKVRPDPPEVVLLDPMRHFSPSVVRHVMVLLLSTTNAAVDQALESVDKSLERLGRGNAAAATVRTTGCHRFGRRFLAEIYKTRPHLLPPLDR